MLVSFGVTTRGFGTVCPVAAVCGAITVVAGPPPVPV